MASMKENSIQQFVDSIDFNRDDWKYSDLLEALQSQLGETPGVDIEYGKDAMLLEGETEAREVEFVSKVSVVFTDTDDKFKKIVIDVDKRFK